MSLRGVQVCDRMSILLRFQLLIDFAQQHCAGLGPPQFATPGSQGEALAKELVSPWGAAC